MIIKNKNAFTLIELLIVIMIISILSTIWFIEYSSSLSEARNSTRISDMWNIKISLKNNKLKTWNYPYPGNNFDITNSWTIIKQWLLNQDVYTLELDKKPTDPLLKTRYYTYSVTNNKLFFQIAMSLEDENAWNDSEMVAFVDWDFQTVAPNFVPNLVFATTISWTINSLSWKVILDKWILNLPYDKNWDVVANWNTLTLLLSETWITIQKFCWYSSCDEIYENWRSFWSWSYCMLDTSGNLTYSWCVMNY